MSVVEWVVDVLRFAFLDTASGVVGAIFLYVYVKLGIDVIRSRGSGRSS